MSYQQNSSRLRRLPDFFGITDSSGLTPLSRIWDNGIINNGKAPGKEDFQQEKKPSVVEKLKTQPQQERKSTPRKAKEQEL